MLRKAFTEPVTLALIGLLTALITVVFEKESDQMISKAIYQDYNNSSACDKLPEIIMTDKEFDYGKL